MKVPVSNLYFRDLKPNYVRKIAKLDMCINNDDSLICVLYLESCNGCQFLVDIICISIKYAFDTQSFFIYYNL